MRYRAVKEIPLKYNALRNARTLHPKHKALSIYLLVHIKNHKRSQKMCKRLAKQKIKLFANQTEEILKNIQNKHFSPTICIANIKRMEEKKGSLAIRMDV